MIPVLASILILGTLGLMQDAFADPMWDLVYNANTLPPAEGFSDLFTAGCTHREIHSGNVYHVTGVDFGGCNQEADVWDPVPATGYTVEFIVKLNSYSGDVDLGGMALLAAHTSTSVVLLLNIDKIKEFHSGQEFAIDTTDAFHIYRITVLGNTWKIYVDGTEELTGTAGPGFSLTSLRWGDGSGGAGGDAFWDCVSYTTMGAFTPSELPGECVTFVDIDIKPGSDPSCFNSDGKGVIPVAILGSAGFDVSTVDPTTIKLDDQGVKTKGNGDPQASIEDVNDDGFDDLVVKIIDGGIYPQGNTIATLTCHDRHVDRAVVDEHSRVLGRDSSLVLGELRVGRVLGPGVVEVDGVLDVHDPTDVHQVRFEADVA